MPNKQSSTPLWSSGPVFYLATVGAAVGLGSIWRLPYQVGSSGGSAFLFVFTIACLLIATPLLAAEFLIGRHSRLSPPAAAGAVERDRRARHDRGVCAHVHVHGGGGLGARLLVEVRQRCIGGDEPARGRGPVARISVESV